MVGPDEVACPFQGILLVEEGIGEANSQFLYQGCIHHITEIDDAGNAAPGHQHVPVVGIVVDQCMPQMGIDRFDLLPVHKQEIMHMLPEQRIFNGVEPAAECTQPLQVPVDPAACDHGTVLPEEHPVDAGEHGSQGTEEFRGMTALVQKTTLHPPEQPVVALPG